MAVSLADYAAGSDPPVTVRQLTTLTALAGILPCARRVTGHRGRPVNLYDHNQLTAAHATEAARTVKQFTDNDWIAAALLGRHLIHADPAAGEVWWWSECTRAERLHTDYYGYVHVRSESVAAHRVIWIAAGYTIPPGLHVNHVNGLHWDNRLANLEIVTFGNNIRHARGVSYLTHDEAVTALAELRRLPDALPEPAGLVRVGGAHRRAT